ncbi:hypothetical protein AB0F18_17860 [Streptomyces sp. NPDC029216]|uniref:hypothetical protein n=1 Tax=Streptomyces sp. NPDC029216 TaxID=3154701 RepID=UPI0033CFA35D
MTSKQAVPLFDQAVRLGWPSPVGSVDVDYKHHGGVTTVPLWEARDVALLEVIRPRADWRAVRTFPDLVAGTDVHPQFDRRA